MRSRKYQYRDSLYEQLWSAQHCTVKNESKSKLNRQYIPVPAHADWNNQSSLRG